MCTMSKYSNIVWFNFQTKSIKKINKKWWKKGNNSTMVNQIYFKIERYVDLDMLQFFAI
jgi:hypothetical protein